MERHYNHPGTVQGACGWLAAFLPALGTLLNTKKATSGRLLLRGLCVTACHVTPGCRFPSSGNRSHLLHLRLAPGDIELEHEIAVVDVPAAAGGVPEEPAG